MNIRYIVLIILSILFWRHGYAQYPTSGVKQRLGYQTTGDGLVYRGNGSPAYTPSGINSAWAYIDTTAGTIYTYYAGSWHLVSAGGGGTFDGHVDSLVFNSAVTVVDSVGKMYYDAGNETISVGIDGGAVYQMGQELYYPLVINKSGATILNGQPVMVDTATLVTGDHVRIIPARNGAAYPSDYVMGVATTDIPNDSTGLVTWFGYVREVKEADIAQTGVTIDAGEILYISSTEPGKYTDTPPASPSHKSTIALVVRKPSVNNITLLVRPWLAPKLDNLSNVNTSSVTGLSVLRYNSTTGTWDASATAGIVAADTSAMLSYYQKKLTNPVTGTGTAGQVAYWSGTATQTGSSNLTWNGALNLNSGAKINLGDITSGVLNIQRLKYSTDDLLHFHFSGTEQGYIYFSDGSTRPYYVGKNNSGLFYISSNVGSFYYNGINGRYGLNRSIPDYTLDINATDAIRIPSGTTVQRPTGAAAVLRYNSDSLRVEYHTGTAWKGLAKTEELPVSTSGFPRAVPVAVILSTYTVGATDAWIIFDYAGTVTLTLPSAASYPGREIMVKTIRAQSVVSASSNVVPIDSNTAGTAILAATAGKWATLVSTGSQWVIMQSN